ncbi:hypothetical protein P692DRAFT_20754605 [Suillus brevipes Sb2]|nr:hypothetical protein P692DRAFT_20754605 [Suillus brevipes Sb2]
MPQQPGQTGQWPIPSAAQHRHYPQMPQPPSVPSHVGPYPPGVQTHLHNKFAPAAHPVHGAPYPVPPPQHWGGYPPASQGVGVPPAQPFYPSTPPSAQPFHNQHPAQGLGQQVPAPSFYSAASSWVQPYNQYTQQGLGQPPPVVAAKESAVKRGKRKAVDLDDTRPLKNQAIQDPAASPFVQPYNHGLGQLPPVVAAEESAVKRGKRKAGHIESKQHHNYRAQFPSLDSNKVISRGESSNIGGSSSKTQEEAVAQVPCEASTSNTPLVIFPNSFEDYNWTSSGPLEEPVNSLDQSELAWDEQVKEFFDTIQKAADVAPGELEVVNGAQETDHSASANLLEGFTETVGLASGEHSQVSINSPDGTGDLAPDDLMNSFVKAKDPDLVGVLLRKLIDQWFP